MSKQDDREIQTGNAQETRARIIDAAYRVLAEKGYEATTLREISKAADAAPGLVHYYFGGKDQLLVEVLKTVSERYARMPEELARSADAGDPLRLVLQHPIDLIVEKPEWYRLRQELFALGLHHALMAPQVRELLAEGRESIATSIKNTLGETSADPAVLATMLIALIDGLALQKFMDPDLDISMFADVLARMLRSFAENGD